jgi:ATP synthase protein I
VWRKFRPVIGLQVLATAIIASIAAWNAGVHGAISAALGGLISIIAGLVFVLLTGRNKVRSAGEVLLVAFKAEAAKLFLAIILLWLVLTLYQEVVIVGLIGSFVVSILIFSMALFAGDKT